MFKRIQKTGSSGAKVKPMTQQKKKTPNTSKNLENIHLSCAKIRMWVLYQFKINKEESTDLNFIVAQKFLEYCWPNKQSTDILKDLNNEENFVKGIFISFFERNIYLCCWLSFMFLVQGMLFFKY